MSVYDHDPVDFFNLELKEAYSRRVDSFLADILARSGIDTFANAELAQKINKLISDRDALERKKILWIVLTLLLLLVAAVLLVGLWTLKSDGREISLKHWGIVGAYTIAAAVFIFCKCIPVIRRTGAMIAALTTYIAEKIAEAKAQIAPLFSFMDWDTNTGLMEEIFPEAVYDKFLYRERVDDLLKNFGLDREFTGNRSVLYTHSGTFFGYPFVFLNTNCFTWGSRTYTGSLTIHWREVERDSDGRSRTVTKTEVLTASVTKPYPEFNEEKIMIFGHDAAPELSFSRTPSSLSGAGNSLFNTIGRSWKMNRLKKLERNLEDESQFTMMSNRDFELLFNSTDRDDEVAYRLLYTPLAQQYMVKLLNDAKTGFGDDFMYFKSRMITAITAEHLNTLEFSTEPIQPDEYDLRIVMQKLKERFEDFFRRIYFTFAPLMTVPLYLETRPETVKTEAATADISLWELESIANYHGESYYKHPASITGNLLKVHNASGQNGKITAQVTASGFKGSPRTDFIAKRGGDGRMHTISVDWVEYTEVKRTTSLSASNAAGIPESELKNSGMILRRGILSSLPPTVVE